MLGSGVNLGELDTDIPENELMIIDFHTHVYQPERQKAAHWQVR